MATSLGFHLQRMWVDPWRGSDRYYVSHYRKEFETLADSFSTEHRRIYVWFDARSKDVKLQTSSGFVLASVRIEGEMCRANHAFVKTNLPEPKLTLFSQILDLPISLEA